jgi:hypothetical protein
MAGLDGTTGNRAIAKAANSGSFVLSIEVTPCGKKTVRLQVPISPYFDRESDCNVSITTFVKNE